ncbi:MAG: TonB-dependent receptor [Acidobacteria bacterium]|nr:TonB-dependent receptor [Acidobacteriota bacterium]
MRRLQLVSALVGFIAMTAGPAFAQTVGATTGAVNGKVSDATGGVMPGVTVTISSPAMQGVRTTVTSEDGAYRFPAIPPGDYKITYELAGFATVNREGIHVGLGFTASVNVELTVASLTESVTVSGQSPVVDITSTKTSTNFDAKELASLPSARDFWSILAAAPAIQMQRIDIGGSAAGTQTGYSTYDTKSDQHRPMVEGIVNTEGTNAAGFYYDYGSFDEVSVATGTNTAEMPWPGVMTQFIAKSGGNTYHGKVYADYENESAQSRNIDAAQIALGLKAGGGLTETDLNRLHKYYDLNGDAGGYLKRDKFWWYGSLRDQDVQSLLPNFPVKPFETLLYNISGKGTYALNTNNKLIGYAQWGEKQQPNRLDTFLVAATAALHTSADSTWNQAYWAHTYKGEWDSVVNDRMFFEIRGGQFAYVWPNTRYTEAPAYADLSTNVVSGGNRDGWFNIPTRNQVLGSFSYFKDGWGGSHNFKIGGEIFDERFDYQRGQGIGYVPNNVIHILRNGAPSEVLLFLSPTASLNGLRTYGAYIADTWRVGPRLTLSLGARFDRYRSYLPEQTGPPVGPFNPTQASFAAVDDLLTWNLPAPRLGFTYDLRGDGKTVLKANYALYWWNPGTGGVDEAVNPNAVDWNKRYNWVDTNRDRVWQPGEQTLLTAQSGGVGSTNLDPNLQDQRTRELAGWIDHELMPNFGVHAGVVWRRIDQLSQQDNLNRPVSAFNVPVLIRDPGPDGVLGNADDGASIPGFNLNPANLALPVVNGLHNTPGYDDFYTLELSASKRSSGKWSLAGSYSYRWNYDNSNGYFGQNLRVRQDVANPNDAINTDNGRYNFTLWSAKAHGTYRAPWNLEITPALRLQSGQPYGRTISAAAANGINYGSQRILTEPISARRQDNIILADLRVEKLFKVNKGQTISAFIDGYNLTNANPASNITWGSGSTFLLPVTIIAPRLARVGMKFDW